MDMDNLLYPKPYLGVIPAWNSLIKSEKFSTNCQKLKNSGQTKEPG